MTAPQEDRETANFETMVNLNLRLAPEFEEMQEYTWLCNLPAWSDWLNSGQDWRTDENQSRTTSKSVIIWKTAALKLRHFNTWKTIPEDEKPTTWEALEQMMAKWL